ncbi:MAG TPA: hypothetical protein VGK01_14385 [Candidatus Angelobacter sp.]|jgi:hypothetical protein
MAEGKYKENAFAFLSYNEFMVLQKVTANAAGAFFRSYEHLGNCGLGVWHWAAVANDQITGVISFGTTCFARSRGELSVIANAFELPIYQICRGATAYPACPNTASQVLSNAMRALRRERGDCADRFFHEVGTIYQACNGIYTGLTKPKNQANYRIHERTVSGWVIRKRYGTRTMDRLRAIDPNVVKIPLSPKYRYVFVQAAPRIKSKVLIHLKPLAMPYPKRSSERIAPMDVSALINHRFEQAVTSGLVRGAK